MHPLLRIIPAALFVCGLPAIVIIGERHVRAAPPAPATFSNSRPIGDLRYDQARGEAWGVVYEFTDPANGERFLVVVSRDGVAIASAHPPLPQPAPYPAGGGTAAALDQ